MMLHMRILFIALLLIPAIEIGLFIEAGSRIGTLNTLALIITTAIIGVALIRQQGIQTVFRAREKMNRGETPAYEMLEGMFFALAGILLLTPGFFTDTVGFLILIPFLRRLMISRMTNMAAVYSHTTQQTTSQRTIEGEYNRTDKQD